MEGGASIGVPGGLSVHAGPHISDKKQRNEWRTIHKAALPPPHSCPSASSAAESAAGMTLAEKFTSSPEEIPKLQEGGGKIQVEAAVSSSPEKRRLMIRSLYNADQGRAELLTACAAAHTLKQTDARSPSSSAPLLPPLPLPHPLHLAAPDLFPLPCGGFNNLT